MPSTQLTDISIRSLKPPEKGPVTYRDKIPTGFGVRVSQRGTKSCAKMYGANRQRTTLEKFPIINPPDTVRRPTLLHHSTGHDLWPRDGDVG